MKLTDVIQLPVKYALLGPRTHLIALKYIVYFVNCPIISPSVKLVKSNHYHSCLFTFSLNITKSGDDMLYHLQDETDACVQ